MPLNAPSSRADRLSRRYRRRFYAALTALSRAAFRSVAPGGPLRARAVRRMLVVRDDRIGDLVVSTPLLSFLRDVAPQAEVDVVCSRTNAELLATDERVSRVFINNHTWIGRARLLRSLRERKYDMVFSVIYGHAVREGLFASFAALPHTAKVSVWRPKRYHGLFTHVVRNPPSLTHMAEQVLHVGAAAFGSELAHDSGAAVNCRRYPMRLHVSETSQATARDFLRSAGVQDFVAVNLWAAEPWRVWRPALCASLLSRLASRHPELSFVLAPPPDGEGAAEDVRRASGSVKVLIFPSRARLMDRAALVSRARLAITTNTAAVHIASACARPVLALYSAMRLDKNQHWLPLGVPHRTLFAPTERAVSDIPLGDIERAFEALIAELRASSAGVT